MASLPSPTTEQLSHSEQLQQAIVDEIHRDGWIPFARYMELALYAPGLGYYSAGSRKFGVGGDFVTAPEISPLFSRTLARQAAQVVSTTAGDILELGAGTGRLAADLLLELQALGTVPQHYFILDVSAYLREVQQQTLTQLLSPELLSCVRWLEQLPETFTGFAFGNEVLDALPVHLAAWRENGIFERGVAWESNTLTWAEQPLQDKRLLDMATAINPMPDYLSEFCPAALGLVASLAQALQRGTLLFIDYGFPRREYYHPQRSNGTLMCHYRQLAHDNPLLYPGLQDITAHVDFTGIAEAAITNGLQLAGYTTQANFLINCGITDLLSAVSPADSAAYLPLAAQAQKLMSPAEMGELFKVIACSKNLEFPLLGFQRGDKRHTL